MSKRFSALPDTAEVENLAASRLKLFVLASFSLVVVVGLAALLVFFLAIRGAEQSLVPDVVGKPLTEALLELQAKELYPRLQLRYSQNAEDKDIVLDQEPQSGAIVKAGRRIKLVVSRGLMVEKIEDFVGRGFDDVKSQLSALFSTSAKPLLSVKDPPMYEFSPEPAGTILEQDPPAGTDVVGPLALEFIVSRGSGKEKFKVPDIVGLPYIDAIDRLSEAGVCFTVGIRPALAGEKPETVMSQDPAGQSVIDLGTRVAIEVTMPSDLTEEEAFGVFSASLPEYPYALALKLDAMLPNGERRRLYDADHPGGEFSVPYRLPRGTVLTLTALNRMEKREELP